MPFLLLSAPAVVLTTKEKIQIKATSRAKTNPFLIGLP